MTVFSWFAFDCSRGSLPVLPAPSSAVHKYHTCTGLQISRARHTAPITAIDRLTTVRAMIPYASLRPPATSRMDEGGCLGWRNEATLDGDMER